MINWCCGTDAREKPMKMSAALICPIMLIVLGSACSRQPAGQPEGAANASAGAAASSSAASGAGGSAPAVRQQDLGKLADLVVAEDADLPRAEFDPAVLVAALGRDPLKLHAWVRDRTWWAPYRGLLRGARGVMLDRIGSNLDRAVLLGELLRRAGFTVRLAHAQLPEGRARELLARVRAIPDQRRDPIAPHDMSADRQGALETIVPGLMQDVRQQTAESQRVGEQAVALVRSQSEQLLAAVGKAAGRNVGMDDAAAIAALRDYWWVEREDHGQWSAMDVLLPDAKPGEVLVQSTDTRTWDTPAAAPAIAATDWHAVRIRVVVERYEAGATREVTALETTLHPAEVLDRPITLTHYPKPWPDQLAKPAADPNALGNAAVNVREWVPVLRVGTETVTQSGFTESGDPITDPFAAQRDIAKVGGGGMMGGFDAALGGGEVAASSVTAEWIDFEVHVPGEQDQQLRTTVFDVLGPTKRKARATDFDAGSNAMLIERYAAMLGRIDILLQPCEFTNEFVAGLAASGIVASQAAIREFARERDPARSRELVSRIREHLPSWGPLVNLALWRSALGAQPTAWFIDRPNVLIYRASRPVVNADRAIWRESIDLASNASGVRQGAGVNAFSVRVRQGVADTVAETLALGGVPGSGEDAASIFGAEGFAPERSVLVRARDLQAVGRLGWPEDVSARLADDVGSGFATVAIKAPVTIRERERLGWWRVHPVSGETIGVMDDGSHGAAEDAEMRHNVAAMRNFLNNNADAISQARQLRSLTPGQSQLLRTAQAAERAIAEFECMFLPFPC
jgi:hypothetical protein